ncbi:MAG: phosphate ABC transporter substrate-binding protein PstS [Thermoplasmata archaeon]
MSAASTPPPSDPATPTAPMVRRKRNTGAIVAVVAVIIIVGATLGVGYEQGWFGKSSSKNSTTCGPGTELQGDGAQFVTPLVTTWESNYQSQTGNLVNYPSSGSGTGLTHFTDKELDFAITDNPLSASEVAALPGQALTLPVVGGALAIVYNVPGVSGHLNLSGNVIAGIYLGTIKTWNNTAITSLNPGVSLPSATIVTVHRSGSAGTSYVLSDFLTQDNATWATQVGKSLSPNWPSAPDQTAASSNSVLLTTVEMTSNSIGYSDLTDVLASGSSSLGYAAIQNPAHYFIVPTVANTVSAIDDKFANLTKVPTSTGSWYNVSMVNANGTVDYPLATFAYMYVYQATNIGFEPSLEKSQVLLQWVDWVLSTGQTYTNAGEEFYAVLPSALIAVDQAGIATMTYNGAAIPACS